jgi:hypothetical protein
MWGGSALMLLAIELSLYGMSTSCTEASGTATVGLIDRRIIGCSIEGDGGLCTHTESGYLDSTWPSYLPGSATFDQVALPSGASATCQDVVAALPDTEGVDGGIDAAGGELTGGEPRGSVLCSPTAGPVDSGGEDIGPTQWCTPPRTCTPYGSGWACC